MNIDNKTSKLTLNPIPFKTWNYLRVNDTTINAPTNINNNEMVKFTTLSDNVKLMELSNENTEIFKDIHSSLGIDVENWLKNIDYNKYLIFANSTDKEEKVCNIECSIEDNENHALQFMIYAKSGSKNNFIFDCKSPKNSNGFLYVSVLLYLEDDANVHLSKVQRLGEDFSYLSDIGVMQKENSNLDVLRINLGANHSYLGLKSLLSEKNAKINSQLSYYEHNNENIDINDWVVHIAHQTNSLINAQGVLSDNSYKSYKGTIDLQRGCTSSKGQELENILLMSDDVINKSTPIILCGEDDVEANHGATIGRFNKDILIYLKSRGISEEDAKLLLVKGKLNTAVSQIQNDKLKEEIDEYLKEVLSA